LWKVKEALATAPIFATATGVTGNVHVFSHRGMEYILRLNATGDAIIDVLAITKSQQ
jgi:hypothetical protein